MQFVRKKCFWSNRKCINSYTNYYIIRVQKGIADAYEELVFISLTPENVEKYVR